MKAKTLSTGIVSRRPRFGAEILYLFLLLSLTALYSCAPKRVSGARPPSEARPPAKPSAPQEGVKASERPYQVMGRWYYPMKSGQATGYKELGYASWYGAEFHGKPTSSGEPFDMHQMTAAHKTLPLDTHVKVTHLGKGGSIVVRVNDRGPFVEGRIIDLSVAAAKALGMYGQGLARVEIEALGFKKTITDETGRLKSIYVQPESYNIGDFAVQVASFKDPMNAERFKNSLKARFPQVTVVPYLRGGETFHRVQVMVLHDLEKAREEAKRLSNSGFPGAFAVAVDQPNR